MKKEVDYIVVGQGIAGTLLAFYLLEAGSRITVIDDESKNSASAVSSGLINPITGRQFVKSWMIDQLLPQAKRSYHRLASLLNERFVNEISLVRRIASVKDENLWESQRTRPGYEQYMMPSGAEPIYETFLKDSFSFGRIQGAMQVQVKSLLSHFREYLIEHKNLVEEQLDYQYLWTDKHRLGYKGIEAKGIIFAEGWQVGNNPFFKSTVYQPVKGEVFFCRIPGFPNQSVLKYKKFFVPMGQDLFWVGSTYEWDYTDAFPDMKKAYEIKSFLDYHLKVPYEILDHTAGIRPATRNRRPIVGRHPDNERLFILNGMGTKGISLAPYWAKKLIDDILNGNVNPVNI